MAPGMKERKYRAGGTNDPKLCLGSKLSKSRHRIDDGAKFTRTLNNRSSIASKFDG